MSDTIDHRPSSIDLSSAERMARNNWLATLERSMGGAPLVWPEFVARQGRSVRIIDVREADELVGPLGHIPGVEWIPKERAESLAERLDRNAKIVLVSRAGERSGPLARELEERGMPFVASMIGGMVTWNALGFAITRDGSVLSRRDQLRTEPPPKPLERPLSLSSIEAHVGDPASVRWMKLAALMLHGRFSCVDGRDETGVIGTPGGDSGEFLLALTALERVTGDKLSALQIRTLFARRLGTFGRFYLHGDVHSANALIKAIRADKRFSSAIGDTFEPLEWRRFFNAPPAHIREPLMEYMVDAAHIGCGHMRLAMQLSDTYGARPALVKEILRSFYRARWDGSLDTEYTVLPGGHEEGAVVNVRVDEALRSFTQVPLISPTAGGTQMFVNHPQVSENLRRDLAHFLVRQGDAVDVEEKHFEALVTEMGTLAGLQLTATLERLAKGLPIYDVVFGKNGSFHVEAQGTVG
jgi:rhodanese-related sulfurtransferase